MHTLVLGSRTLRAFIRGDQKTMHLGAQAAERGRFSTNRRPYEHEPETLGQGDVRRAHYRHGEVLRYSTSNSQHHSEQNIPICSS